MATGSNPYSPPAADLHDPNMEGVPPLSGRAKLARMTYLALAGVTAVELLTSLIAGAASGENQDSPLLLVVAGVAFLEGILSIAAFITLLVWIHRAVRVANLLHSKPQPRSPAMTVASFLIPIVNLFWPFQSMRALYQAADPHGDQDDWSLNPKSSLAAGWWAAVIFGQVMNRIVLADLRNNGLDASSPLIDGFSSLSTLATALLAAAIIRQVSDRWADRLASAGRS